MNEQKRIYVGLSGGVDSSVAALLLKELGHEVIGVFMKNWSDCDWIGEERWAKKVAAHLGISCETWDFEKEYKEKVLTNFYDEYKKGRTPNPDILCNKYIKFDLFLKKALSEGADAVATGHYADVRDNILHKGRDTNKDQSYFLYTLTKDQLSKIIFPLGELTKPQVRELAKNAELPNFDKKDSQGICFVGTVDIKTFLEKELPRKSGLIVDEKCEQIGVHDGIHFYTEGQREGLNLGGLKEPHYVAYKDIENNILVATRKGHPLMYAEKVLISELHLIRDLELPEMVQVKVRYRQDDQEASVVKTKDGYEIVFAKPQASVSEGQSVVLYHNGEVLGGGVIDRVYRAKGLVESLKISDTESHAINRN